MHRHARPPIPVGPAVKQHRLHSGHQRGAHGARQARRQRVVHPPADVTQHSVHLLLCMSKGRGAGEGKAGGAVGLHSQTARMLVHLLPRPAATERLRGGRAAPAHPTHPALLPRTSATSRSRRRQPRQQSARAVHPAPARPHLQDHLQAGHLDVEAVQPLKDEVPQVTKHHLGGRGQWGGCEG